MLVLLVCVLAGCAGAPPAPIEIPVPCRLPEVDRPAEWEFDTLPADASVYAQVNALLVEREQRQAYEGKLEAVQDGCR